MPRSLAEPASFRVFRPFALLLAVLTLASGALPGNGAVTTALAANPSGIPVNDRLGIGHISYGNGFNSPERYRLAQSAGVGWNRWVFYWNEIERVQGAPDYTRQDRTVAADTAQNFKILGILLGTPDWASGGATGARAASLPPPQVGQRRYPAELEEPARRLAAASPITLPPQGMERPVFSDGTDVPGPGKSISAANPWARFVFQTATRYRGKVQAWEIWNEPDFTPTAGTGWFGFWSGTVDQYARLLKVAYLAVKAADPNATVVSGGMAFWFQPDFYPRLLRSIRQDPNAAANGYYFDVTAWHWYSRASQLYERTLWIKDELAKASIAGKRVWVTEANLPVCGDPGLKERLTCTAGSHRGTLDHQAAFMVQAIAYAWVAGVERVFIFQLYDDELGAGEYYGLVRNDGTARPALAALRVASTYFAGANQVYRTLNSGGRVEMITILNDKNERLRILWGTGKDPAAVALPVEGVRPIRVDQYGSLQPVPVAAGSAYRMGIAPATLDDSPRGAPDYIVGGSVVILLEGAAPSQRGRVLGTVRDSDGRPLAGVPVQVGDHAITSAGSGEFGVDVLPGLYDVAVAADSPFPAKSPPALSLPVWSGKAVNQPLDVEPQRRLVLPFIVRRSQQPVPR